MNITGIIAEYNPFHNGHAYQLTRAREETGADYIIVVMSGNYVQRGTPALLDKYVRAEMALMHGADLVLELPVLWSCASAQYFAGAGVSLLHQLGCVSSLCYGCETPDCGLFGSLCALLCSQPEEYRRILTDSLKAGDSYALAREKAAAGLFPPTQLAKIQDILRNPNNILALEYQLAAAREASPIKLYPIKRIGAGYHSNSITIPDKCNNAIDPDSRIDAPAASATAIRSLLRHYGTTVPDSVSEKCFDCPDCSDCFNRSDHSDCFTGLLGQTMPPAALRLLLEYQKTYPLIYENDCSQMLHYSLIKGRAAGFADFADCSGDLSNKICRRLNEYTSFKGFCDLLKSKDLAYTRISRCLLHILLDLKKSSYDFWRSRGYMPYARVLGFCRSSGSLLTHIKKHSSLPLFMRASDARKILTDKKDMDFFEQAVSADQIYRALAIGKNGHAMPDEYHRKMLVLP